MKTFNLAFPRNFALFLLGSICVLGFAPFYIYPVSVLSLISFFILLQRCHSLRAAIWSGFFYGLGMFCVGIYWIYISLHDFGGMPVFMAAFATFVLAAFMASFTGMLSGLAFWVTHKQSTQPTVQQHFNFMIAIALFWGLFDWTKSWIFTGFPWLTIGYTQVPDGPLAGFVPIIGIYGVSTLTVLSAGLIALFLQYCVRNHNTPKPFVAKIIIPLLVLFISGPLLHLIEWSKPIGDPVNTSLLQGNIAQDLKWSPNTTAQTIGLYLDMIKQSQSALIVLPETALPILSNQLSPETHVQLVEHAKQNHGNIILGIVEYDAKTKAYFNGAMSFGVDPTQHYAKSHLVPFGEFIPFKQIFAWVYRDWLNMPMSDMSRGDTHPAPMSLAGQQVAINICYEDVFGEEIIRQLPQATLLVNITNDAWYGESFAADQHMQFSQARALETARTMLRATNTGASAMISPKGQVLAHAPHFQATTLQVSAQGYTGTTPYVRFGNWPFIIFSLVLTLLFIYRKYTRK